MRLLVLCFITFFKYSAGQFEVPDALVEVFRPRGLRVSIPDQEGIKLFAFHAKVNEEMNGREGGTFSRDITKAKNGRWTFYDPSAKLKVGDVIYYWTYVDYFDGKNKLGYANDDLQFVVKELLEKDTSSTKAPTVTTQTTEEVTESSGCKSSPTKLGNDATCSQKVIFHEDFNSLDNNLWSPENKFAGSPDYEFVVYTTRRENLEVNDGHLKIRPVLSEDLFGKGYIDRRVDLGINCTGVLGSLDCVQEANAFLILPPVASAQISTKNKFSFKFGKIEIRAKLPKGDWIYPELYLNPLNEPYGPDYASGQIRIAFLPGNEQLNRNLRGGCILGSSQAGRNYGMKTIKKNTGTWGDDFHVFTVVWKPDQITVSVDDTVYGNIYAPPKGFVSESHNLELGNVERWSSGTPFAPFDKEMYLTIGVGVGGHVFPDRSDGTKPWQNSDGKGQKKFYKATSQWRPSWTDASLLDVDYIKVSAL
ncbi:beta-1,3-glucan-binding protein-like [Zophobas morio]|uniref:beta-1,3-glucan-binding protein-like n=1 Tax=Zophobas morio TaxID=2755281 RepID=UPI0030833A8A